MIKNPLFPINCTPRWQSPEAFEQIDPHSRDWLLHTGSLTERLQSHCQVFTVQLLGQQCLPLSPEEAKVMTMPEAVIREVLLCGDGVPWVYARSLFSPQLAQQNNGQLKQLGTQPLGKIIFNDPAYQRQPFEIARVESDSAMHLALDIRTPLWARRSLFEHHHQHLCVTEFFLPASPACLKGCSS